MKHYFTLRLLALLFTGLVTNASATTYTFANAGNWNSFGTWVGDLLPPNPLPAGDFIVIDADCTLNLSRTINGTLTVNAGKTLTLSYTGEPSRTFTNGGTLNNQGTIDVFGDFKLVNSAGRTITNFSGAIIRSNLVASVDNYGTLVNNSGGAINIQQFGGVNNESGGLVTNNGTITSGWIWVNKSGSTLDNNGTIGTASSGGVTNENGGIMNINSGSTFNVYCTATNAGTININTGGTLYIYATLTNTGTLTSSGTLRNQNTLVNNGTIGSTLQLIGPGILRGGGFHLGFFTNNATLAPGSAVNIPGCYYFQAGFTNTNRISMDINGSTACTQFDQVQVIGAMTKGGTLALKFGFTPTVGQTFQIMTATSFAGSFAFFESNPTNIQFTESGGIVTITANLPVELTNFSAKALEKTVRLDWTTATETNNQGFFIERSPDATRWETLGFTPGQGNNTATVHYSLLDEKPLNGRSYYRLLQVDFDGRKTFSPIVQVIRKDLPGKVLVYPNPVAAGTPCTLVSTLGPVGEMLALRLLDAAGRQVVMLTDAQYLDTKNLQPGIYWLEAQSAQGTSMEKIVIQ